MRFMRLGLAIQALGRGAHDSDPPARRVAQHGGGGVDTHLDPEGGGKARRAHTDLQPQPVPRQERAYGQQLGLVGRSWRSNHNS